MSFNFEVNTFFGFNNLNLILTFTSTYHDHSFSTSRQGVNFYFYEHTSVQMLRY